MSKRVTISILLVTGILSTAAIAVWWIDRPRRVVGVFVGHMSHGRYAEASRMLQPPSAIDVAADGGLILIDRTGRSTTVPATKLPFLSGGGRPRDANEFSMTALGPSINGVLVQPAVVLHLNLDGVEVRIESIDP